MIISGVDAEDDPNPIIGWSNFVTEGNVTSSTAATGYPVTNLAGINTNLLWRGGVNTGSEDLDVVPGSTDDIDYVALARHNLGSAGITVHIFGKNSRQVSIVPFDGTDISTSFPDIGNTFTPHVWTAVGNAQLDTAQFKFGTASLLLDGSGDYVFGDGTAGGDFDFGSNDFTIDLWVRFNSLTGQQTLWDFRRLTGSGPNDLGGIYKMGTNELRLFTQGTDKIIGTTAVVINTWYHVALTRSSGITRMFLNGVQQGSNYIDSTNYTMAVAANRPTIGANGDSPGNNALNGWIDEFRVHNGTALWTANFGPPAVSSDGFISMVGDTLLDDDDPVIFRFGPQPFMRIKLRFSSALEAPEAGLLFVGKLLVLERSVKVDAKHTPFNLGQATRVIGGLVENGHLLGRLLQNRNSVSTAEFEHFTPDWYRENFQPFVEGAQDDAFFFAWDPSEYPQDVGYAWLVEDPKPAVDPVTRRVAIQLKMEGLIV